AVSGVIQIFTQRGTDGVNATATVGGGSFGAQRYEAGLRGAHGGLRWSLGGAHHSTDGILAFNNAFTNDVLSAAASWERGAVSLGTTLRYTDHLYRYPTDGGGALADSNAFTTDRRLVASVDAGYQVRPGLTFRGRATRSQANPRQRDLADGPADTVGFFGFRSDATVTRELMEVRAEALLLGAHLVTVGLERTRDHEENTSVSLSEFGDFPGALTAERTNVALV